MPVFAQSSGVMTRMRSRLEFADGGDHRERRFDGPIVVQLPGELRLVVALDHGLVVGHEAAQSRERHRLAVGEVMHDLAGGPLSVWLRPVQFLVGDADEGIGEVVHARSVALDPVDPIHASSFLMSSGAAAR